MELFKKYFWVIVVILASITAANEILVLHLTLKGITMLISTAAIALYCYVARKDDSFRLDIAGMTLLFFTAVNLLLER